MKTGTRFEQVELSTIDTTLLLAGALFCQSYFDRDEPEEAEIRALAETLYRRGGMGLGAAEAAAGVDGLASGKGLHRLRLDRLQRGDDPLRAGARLAHASDRAGGLGGVYQHLPVG